MLQKRWLLSSLSVIWLAACTTSTATTPPLTTSTRFPTVSPTVLSMFTPAAPVPTATLEPTFIPPPPKATSTPLTHVVQTGENLFRIALRYNITVEALRLANGLSDDLIYAGQVFVIPASGAPTLISPQPTSTTTPAAAGFVVQSFTVGPNPVERTTAINVNWNVPGATYVSIWPMTFDRKTGRWYRVPAGAAGYLFSSPLGSGGATGQLSATVPLEASRPLRFELEANNTAGATVTAQSEVINLVCHPSIANVGNCPLPAQSAPGAFQTFENGSLLWRGDTGQILILATHPAYYVPWSLQANPTQPASVNAPPAGHYPPSERFASAWATLKLQAGTLGASTPELKELTVGEILGWATAPEQTYTLNVQYHTDNVDDSLFNDRLVISLPDGRWVTLMPYQAFVLTTGPTWGLITP